MLELQFDKARIECDEGTWLCLRVRDAAAARAFVFKCKGIYTAVLKKFHKRRSLDANAYFWQLCGQLSAVIHIPMQDIYRDLVRNIGDNFEILPIKNEAVERFRQSWGAGKLGWVVDEIGPSRMEGYTNVCAYYGSSVYDSRQMSALIDLMVQECRQQGIETMTALELDRLKGDWPCVKRQKELEYQAQ